MMLRREVGTVSQLVIVSFASTSGSFIIEMAWQPVLELYLFISFFDKETSPQVPITELIRPARPGYFPFAFEP